MNGGTTNFGGLSERGTLNKHFQTLVENGIVVDTFHEPDLGDQLTAVVFLVDDRVWDKENYPDYAGPWITWGVSGKQEPLEIMYNIWKTNFSIDPKEADRIVFLRDFLKQFKLA